MKNKFISARTMERLLRAEGAGRVSKEAAVLLAEKAEEFAQSAARKAVKNALLDGRKTVRGEDVNDVS